MTLSYCYNDMPSDIKTCLLYLSIFPKDCRISRKLVMRQRIAEGFVSEQQKLSAEEVAEAYFNHLIRRAFIKPLGRSSDGKVKSCHVPNLVFEYIVSKASEENFVTVTGKASEENFVTVAGNNLFMPQSTSRARRLSVHGGCSEVIGTMNLSHVRTLIMFGVSHQLPRNSFEFGVVQVLVLEGCNGFQEHHAKEICKMLLLKFLSLRRTDIKRLPRKIGKLRYLETLDIRETNIAKLPKTLFQLERLVSILGGNKRRRKGLKLCREIRNRAMQGLQVLSGIEIVEDEPGAASDLHLLTSLRKLAIYRVNVKKDDNRFKELMYSIEYLGGYSLQTLIIYDETSVFLKSLDDMSSPPKFLKALELSGNMVELPQWFTQLDDLNKLTLSVTALRVDNLKLLGNLLRLSCLTFQLSTAKQDPEAAAICEENKAQPDREIVIPAEGFKNLKLLRFSAPLLPALRFPENAMSNLELLELRFRNLEGLYGIDNLKSLKELHLVLHKSCEATERMVRGIATEVREVANGPRVVVDCYYDIE